MKHQLLFVDDEMEVLEGIQDSLRKYRKQWNMSFVCGGKAAIVEIGKMNFDVIICDGHMPIVDGVDVFMYAKQHSPASIRIMLSGYSEVSKTIKVCSLAHRYLNKPCDQEELEATIKRSFDLSKALNDETIRKIAGRIDLLPVAATQHQIILDLIKSDTKSVTDIAKVIESNIALTIKVLHLVNSAFFRRQRTIVSAREAVSYLGMELIKAIILADQLFSLADENESIDLDWLERLQKHGLLTASIAKHLLRDTKYAEAAFTAGLLHEIGTLVFELERPKLLDSAAVSRSDGNDVSSTLVDSESSIQIKLGAYLLNLWGMPVNIVEAVAFYQKPSELKVDIFDVVGAVHVAKHLAEICVPGEHPVQLGDNLDSEYLKALDLEDQLEGWLLAAQAIFSDGGPEYASNNAERAA